MEEIVPEFNCFIRRLLHLNGGDMDLINNLRIPVHKKVGLAPLTNTLTLSQLLDDEKRTYPEDTGVRVELPGGFRWDFSHGAGAFSVTLKRGLGGLRPWKLVLSPHSVGDEIADYW